MKITSQTKVASANTQLFASAIQTALEKAGIPTSVVTSHNGSYIDVMVPAEFAFDANSLINPERRCGELFWVSPN